MPTETTAGGPQLERGIGLVSATALNVIDMIGVGPFITIPLIVSAAGGPQAMLGWIVGAVLALCDGLVWAELGAAMPNAGGSYQYLREMYGSKKLGRLLSFLFIWQLSFSAPLSIASGCVGLARYAAFFWPRLETVVSAREFFLPLPFIGKLQVRWLINGETWLAIGVLVLATALLYRKISAVGWISRVLAVVVLGTIGWIIFAGLTHFDRRLAFSFPPGAFRLSHSFFTGMGSALLVATYDYWGYYNVCFLGGEIRNPGKNIPRALLLSIALVGSLYIVMNTSILGVVPWTEMVAAAKSDTRFYIVSLFIQRIYGPWAAYLATALVMWTAFASVFSLLLGYSRVPYAAAVDGNYFKVFGKLHPKHHIPHLSLLALAAVTALFCFLRLADLIAALVVIRIVLQFLMQAVGMILYRWRRPEVERPFKMWLFPLPALAACAGFGFILRFRPDFFREIRYALLVLVSGVAIFMVRSWRRQEWPFAAEARS